MYGFPPLFTSINCLLVFPAKKVSVNTCTFLTIIFGITMLGEFLNYLLPFPVPSGVYGLFILLLLLCTGALHTEDVAEVGDFFLDTMPIMFIPAGVGLLDSVQEAESILVPLTVITVISTVFVMVATGCVAQSIIRRKNKGGAKA